MHINLGADLYKIQISTKIPIGTLFKKFICPFNLKKKKKLKNLSWFLRDAAVLFYIPYLRD